MYSLIFLFQLDSFGLWVLHHKAEFTAYNLFTVDLTLLYAVDSE